MRRTVLRDGRPPELSVEELAVPEDLLRAGPGFLGAEDLLERVWGENADPCIDTVTVTIGRRRELGAPTAVTTTPEVGHRMADAPEVG
ncbi:winged helix-turn-helix domain-containing protein [Streptomyces omiyaensis]|uniref:winged helix-turn-helix domain-containing protein n=1 Tax=Streptomyces omiyaensis TaxID=68247 RepID=UPI0036FB8A51